MTKEQIKSVNDVYRDLQERLDCIDWTDYAGEALELSLTESKNHDRFRGNANGRGMSVPTEAKLFLVKRIYDYYTGQSTAPDVTDFFSLQKSCFAAYALAKNARFTKAINEWVTVNRTPIARIASWDYCELINVEEEQMGAR